MLVGYAPMPSYSAKLLDQSSSSIVIIPWRGQVRLKCRVDDDADANNQVSYFWWHVDNQLLPSSCAIEDNGRVDTSINAASTTRLAVNNSEWIEQQPDGSLLLGHPRSTANKGRSSPTTKFVPIEGIYQCEASINGSGSLVSNPVNVRLADLFLEPDASVEALSPSRTSPHWLGNGAYLPGDSALLRCPVISVGDRLHPLIRWFFVPAFGNGLMQPLVSGRQERSIDDGDRNNQQAPHYTYLDRGRFLEIQLGHLPSYWRDKMSHSEASSAGFGHYFCSASIPTGGEGGSDREDLRITSPQLSIRLMDRKKSSINRQLKPTINWLIKPDVYRFINAHDQVLAGKDDCGREGGKSDILWLPKGSSILLPCLANLRPQPNDPKSLKFSWMRMLNGSFESINTINDLRFHRVGIGSLFISDLQICDTGLYQCRISVDLNGTIVQEEALVELKIGQPPHLINDVDVGELKVKSNRRVDLNCIFKGLPQPDIVWVKNGRSIDTAHYNVKSSSNRDSTSSILTIDNSSPVDDTAFFQCLAVNRFGSSQLIKRFKVDDDEEIDILIGNHAPIFKRANLTSLPVEEEYNSSSTGPSNFLVDHVTDVDALVSWTPPSNHNVGLDEEEDPIYQIVVESTLSNRSYIVYSRRPRLRLTKLRPETLYNLYINSLPSDNSKSLRANPDSVLTGQVKTTEAVIRPPMAEAIQTESTQFGTLTLSWSVAKQDGTRIDSDDNSIDKYRITLYNLASRQKHQRDAPPLTFTLQSGALGKERGSRLSYLIKELEPDAFYKASIVTIAKSGIESWPSWLSSTARVKSRPPRTSPREFRLVWLGSRAVNLTWSPPEQGSRAGVIISYTINASCDDWLQPRLINVDDDSGKRTSLLLTGLSPSTRYEMTIAAVTRAGRGPYTNPALSFTTRSTGTQRDLEAESNVDARLMPAGSELELETSTSTSTMIHLKWKPPKVMSTVLSNHRTSYESDQLEPHYLVKWGLVYPGPQSARVTGNQTQYSIKNLDTVPKPMAIPVNLHTSIVGPRSVVVIWDRLVSSANECLDDRLEVVDAVNSSGVTNRHCPPPYNQEAESYQIIVQLLDSVESTGELPDSPDVENNKNIRLINTSETWIRIGHLLPDHRYVIAVRSMILTPSSSKSNPIYGQWSMSQLIEMPPLALAAPNDAPRDLKVTLIRGIHPTPKVSVRVAWQPPRLNKLLQGYRVYYAIASPSVDQNHPSLDDWHQVGPILPATAPNRQPDFILHQLDRGQTYAVRVQACTNQRGGGPFSPIKLFRIPSIGKRLMPSMGDVGHRIEELTVDDDDDLTISQSQLQVRTDKSGRQGFDPMGKKLERENKWLYICLLVGGLLLLFLLILAGIGCRRRQNRRTQSLLATLRNERDNKQVLLEKPPPPSLNKSSGATAAHPAGRGLTTGSSSSSSTSPSSVSANRFLLLSNSSNHPRGSRQGQVAYRGPFRSPREQPIALLLTNGQAIEGGGAAVDTGGGPIQGLLATSVTLSTRQDQFDRPTSVHRPVSWDSDSLHFASVSQHRDSLTGPINVANNRPNEGDNNSGHTPSQFSQQGTRSSSSTTGVVGENENFGANQTSQPPPQLVWDAGLTTRPTLDDTFTPLLPPQPGSVSPLKRERPPPQPAHVNYHQPTMMSAYAQPGHPHHHHQHARYQQPQQRPIPCPTFGYHNSTSIAPSLLQPVINLESHQFFANAVSTVDNGLGLAMNNSGYTTNTTSQTQPCLTQLKTANNVTPRVNAAELLSSSSSYVSELPKESTPGRDDIVEPTPTMLSEQPDSTSHGPASLKPPKSVSSSSPSQHRPATIGSTSSVDRRRRSSPRRRIGARQRRSSSSSRRSGDLAESCQPDKDFKAAISSDALTQEMADLEGLMNDLNAITRKEFNCP